MELHSYFPKLTPLVLHYSNLVLCLPTMWELLSWWLEKYVKFGQRSWLSWCFFPSKHEDLDSISRTYIKKNLGMVVHVCNPSARAVERGGRERIKGEREREVEGGESSESQIPWSYTLSCGTQQEWQLRIWMFKTGMREICVAVEVVSFWIWVK